MKISRRLRASKIGNSQLQKRWTTTAIALVASFAANAAEISLFGTGVSATGQKLSGGSLDPHWQIVAGPGVTVPVPAVVVNNPPSSYYTPADSTWVWAAATGNAATGLPYTFELDVDLKEYDLSSATIKGTWGVDNIGSIFLNGAAAIGTGTLSLNAVVVGNYDTPHAFSITGGFVDGINRLQFRVADDRNPGALNVGGLTFVASSQETHPVEEPPTLLLILISIGLFGWSRLHRCHQIGTIT